MTTIAQFRTKVLALLDDATLTRYTADQVDAAIRLALDTYSLFKPNYETYILDSTGEQRLALPADLDLLFIKKVELANIDSYSDEIPFYAYRQDSQWIIETPGRTVPTGKTFSIEYAARNYIDGLDSASGTTIPDVDDSIFASGAAGYAIQSRVSTKAEANNLNPDEASILMTLAATWVNKFLAYLGSPDTVFKSASWNDSSIDKAY